MNERMHVPIVDEALLAKLRGDPDWVEVDRSLQAGEVVSVVFERPLVADDRKPEGSE